MHTSTTPPPRNLAARRPLFPMGDVFQEAAAADLRAHLLAVVELLRPYELALDVDSPSDEAVMPRLDMLLDSVLLDLRQVETAFPGVVPGLAALMEPPGHVIQPATL